MTFEFTRLRKAGGPLTKRISLDKKGAIVSDSSACTMPRGSARRVKLQDLRQFAEVIGCMKPDEAIALGVLQPGLPDEVGIESRRLIGINGTRPNTVSRDLDRIHYSPGRPSLVLLDFDLKGMPPEVAEKIRHLGGFWRSLVSVVPEIASAARVMRRSTSAGLYRSDTGERLSGSGGLHAYLLAKDGDDAVRFLANLHSRCYLSGLGWMIVGKSGALLERSIVDRTVGSPERLVFEGAPVLEPPLAQDDARRRPLIIDGVSEIDTLAICSPLSLLERSDLRRIHAEHKHRLAPEARRARAAFVAFRAGEIAVRKGISVDAARAIVERQCERRIVLPQVVLPFDDEEFWGITVSEVLADPERFEGQTLADPDEGVEYGVGKAKVLLRADGTPIIHSFAHGEAMYELRHDAETVRAAIEAAPEDQAGAVFVRMTPRADLSNADAERLERLVSQRAKIGARALKADLKDSKVNETRRRDEGSNPRRRHIDPRASLPAPTEQQERLPFLDAVDAALSIIEMARPPIRSADGQPISARRRAPDLLHEMLENDANPRTNDEGQTDQAAGARDAAIDATR